MLNLLNNRTVYLAGPIEMNPDPGSWRNKITLELSKINGIRIWDPLVKPEWCVQITGDDQRHDLEKFKDNNENGGIRSCTNFKELDRNYEIRDICLRLVSACDFIICMIGGRTVGTYEELAHAAIMKKPVLFIGPPDSCWRVAQFQKNDDKIFFDNIESVVWYLNNIDNGSQEVDSLSWIFLNNKWINHAVKS